MTQLNSGLRRFLALPTYYNAFQKLLGSASCRTRLVEEFIRPEPGMRILDIGCGTAEILEFLPMSVDYVGFDANGECIEHARQVYGGKGRFFQAFVTGDSHDAPHSYDIVLACGLLHHLEDREVQGFERTARAALKPGGRLVTLDCAYTPKQNPLARFLISKDRGQNIRSPEGYAEFFDPELGWRAEINICNDLLRVPYTHIIIDAVLESADC